MQDSPVMASDKQYELMYQDATSVLSDLKRTQFDLVRWLVSLQSLVVGVAFAAADLVVVEMTVVPALIGVAGYYLWYSIATEMYFHRVTLARIRIAVGGDFAEFHKEMIAHYLGKQHDVGVNYWRMMRASQSMIIVAATMIAVAAVVVVS